jgi:hypothetical protein
VVIHKLVAGSEKERLRIHQAGKDEDLIVLDTDAAEALAHRVHGHPRERVEVHLHRMHEVEVVVPGCAGTPEEDSAHEAVFALRTYQPPARRVHQPAAHP